MGIESVKMVAIIEIVDPLGEPSHPTTSALKRKDHVHPRRKYVDVCVWPVGRLQGFFEIPFVSNALSMA